MHNKPETLGDIIKYARERSALTVENLADSVGITERYLYKIENENKKPSYDVLFKLIRTLSISPDLIFYPEKPFKDSEIENLLNEKKIPFLKVYNKSDLAENREDGLFYVSAKTADGIEELKKKISEIAPVHSNKMEIVNSFVKKGDTVILVTPIDESAPKGRIILPQQNTSAPAAR